VLILASGCDAVFSLDPLVPYPPSLCGPYAEATPVMFSPELVAKQAHDLSVSSPGVGAVVTEDGFVHHVVPVTFDAGSQTWMRAGMEILRYRGHRTADDTVYGESIDDATTVVEYKLNAGVWNAQSPTVATDPCFNYTIGNEYDVVDPVNGLQLQRATLVKAASGNVGCDVGKDQLVITNRTPPFSPSRLWREDPPRTMPLNDNPAVAPSQAVMTQDLRTIVYAGKHDSEYDLYVTTLDKDMNNFATGQIIDSVSLPGAVEDEPWIDADCTTIWFRRDGVTMTASAVGL
jgi:hypothetical protein